MKTYKKAIILLSALLMCVGVQAQKIERAEPLNWWVGMNTPLQVMFHGEGIGQAGVRVLEKGLKVTAVHKADSPNYLFVDVSVDGKAKPGDYTFEFTIDKKKFTYTYNIGARREGSRERASYTSADMVYLIMPDRFANGDVSNDNTDDTAEKVNRENFHGRHGGDIQGVIDHLDYIASVGVTALWSTPMTLDDEPRGSYHGYACADYYKIDPRFGSNDLYREMTAKAHEHGIKIIMDIVTNHCGTAHWWMNDLPFADWVHRFPKFTNTNGLMSTPMDPNASGRDTDAFYDGWFAPMMPDMNMKNPYMLQYFKQWAVWWIEHMDIDGLRVDTYPYNDKYVMAEWVKSVIDEYPNMSIVGESWYSLPSQTAYWVGGANNYDSFDSYLPMGMDFPLMFAVNSALRAPAADRPGRGGGRATGIYDVMSQDFLYRDPARQLMIFLDNHDTEHLADIADGNPDKVKIGVALLATMRGMPQIWVGTEVMFRSQDLKQGHGSARIDFPGAWPGDARNLFTEAGRTPEEQDVFAYTAQLFNWRKGKDVIHNGRTMQFHSRDGSYVFFRYNDSERVMVAVNISDTPKKIDWTIYEEMIGGTASGRDVVSGREVSFAAEYEIQPYGTAVIEFTK